MILDFSAPNGLAQLDCAFLEAAPVVFYYPYATSQVKVQGQLFVARVDRPDAIDRLNRRIGTLMRALTAA